MVHSQALASDALWGVHRVRSGDDCDRNAAGTWALAHEPQDCALFGRLEPCSMQRHSARQKQQHVQTRRLWKRAFHWLSPATPAPHWFRDPGFLRSWVAALRPLANHRRERHLATRCLDYASNVRQLLVYRLPSKCGRPTEYSHPRKRPQRGPQVRHIFLQPTWLFEPLHSEPAGPAGIRQAAAQSLMDSRHGEGTRETVGLYKDHTIGLCDPL